MEFDKGDEQQPNLGTIDSAQMPEIPESGELAQDISEARTAVVQMDEPSGSSQTEPSASSLQNKAIIVSGGTTGIGRAIALRLLQAGAKVLIFGRHEEQLDEALDDFKAQGQTRVVGMVTDQTVYEQLETVFERAEKELGGLDVIINCAGISAGKITEGEYRDWRYAIEVNLVGLMGSCRLAMDRMIPRKKGHIVNIGSMSAEAEEVNSVYVAGKSGVRGFTQSLAQEANKEGIRVTLIEPGWVDTDMAKEEVDDTESKVKKGKMLRAQDIAECVHYVLTQPARCNVEFVQIRPLIEE